MDRVAHRHIGDVIALPSPDNVSTWRAVDLVTVAECAGGVQRAVILVDLGGEEVSGEVVRSREGGQAGCCRAEQRLISRLVGIAFLRADLHSAVHRTGKGSGEAGDGRVDGTRSGQNHIRTYANRQIPERESCVAIDDGERPPGMVGGRVGDDRCADDSAGRVAAGASGLNDGRDICGSDIRKSGRKA